MAKNKLLKKAIYYICYGCTECKAITNLAQDTNYRRAKKAVKGAKSFRVLAKHITYLDRYGHGFPITKVRLNAPNFMHSMDYQELELRALAKFHNQFKGNQHA